MSKDKEVSNTVSSSTPDQITAIGDPRPVTLINDGGGGMIVDDVLEKAVRDIFSDSAVTENSAAVPQLEATPLVPPWLGDDTTGQIHPSEWGSNWNQSNHQENHPFHPYQHFSPTIADPIQPHPHPLHHQVGEVSTTTNSDPHNNDGHSSAVHSRKKFGQSSQNCMKVHKAKKKKVGYKHIPHSEKPAGVVAKRNARERRRVQTVNQAFVRLSKAVPQSGKNGKRISKVRVLQQTIDYIQTLHKMVTEHDNLNC